MVFADDIRKVILELADERGSKNAFYPAEVARLIDPKNWKSQMEQVELVAEALIQEGQITSRISKNTSETAYVKAPLIEK